MFYSSFDNDFIIIIIISAKPFIGARLWGGRWVFESTSKEFKVKAEV